jgi:16S rRNA (adenine(1408)-N(1))-methyltransferase
VTIDVGTGDGRAVLAAAAAEPTSLVLGLDADAGSMAEASRRAAGSPRKGGLPNAMFLVAAAERPPAELRGVANGVTVQLPWGSLLRGCLGAEPTVAAGLAAMLAPEGTLDLLLAPADRDRLNGLPIEPDAVADAAVQAFASFGLSMIEGRRATDEEIRGSRSTWARRLLANGGNGTTGIGRTVVLVRLRSCER